MQTNTVTARYVTISADGSSVVTNVSIGNTVNVSITSQHVALDTTDTVYMLRNNGIIKISANGTVPADFSTIIGTLLNYTDLWDFRTATDPTGTLIFTTWDTGDRGRSSDGGATFSGIPNLPFGSDYSYAYAGGEGSESRWIAARGIIRYSPDYGDTWEEKVGDLMGILSVVSLDIVIVMEF